MPPVVIVLSLLIKRAFSNVFRDVVVIYKGIWSPWGSLHVQDTDAAPLLIFWQYPDGSRLDDPTKCTHESFICPLAHAQPDSLAQSLQLAPVSPVCFEWEVTHTLSEGCYGQIVSGLAANFLIGRFASPLITNLVEDWMIYPQRHASACLQLIIKCTHLFLNSSDCVLNTSI